MRKCYRNSARALAVIGLLVTVSTTAAFSKVPTPRPDSLTEKMAPVMSFNKAGTSNRLSRQDTALYADIFKLQETGDFKKADREIARLSDHLLMGHVLYQRYMGSEYKTTYKELSAWMQKYADHPGAREVHALALKKRGRNTDKLERPKVKSPSIGYHSDDIGRLANPWMKNRRYSSAEQKRIEAVKRHISRNPAQALSELEERETRTLLDETTYDALRAQVAESFFYHGRKDKAYALSTVSADRSKDAVPLAGWIAGLSSWKYKKYDDAATYFEMVATSKRSSAWMASAGAYWASRAHLRNRQPEKVGEWLRKAAENPRSFYGIIAVKALGMEQSRFNWDVPELTMSMVEKLAKIPAGKRALGLMDAKRFAEAEAELRQIHPGGDALLQQAMMAVAHNSGAPAFEMRLGSGLKDEDGQLYDAALYPDVPWEPKNGYYIDRALIHAFIRQESKFDHNVRNRRSGATGLMQLMPRTARLVARKYGMKVGNEELQDPSTNIHIGQSYLNTLLQDPGVKNNLFKLAVAYNAGPGNLAKWERQIEYGDDPLLFIESIPVKETREFVEKVLTNYWIYRLKYARTTRTLESVASGEWPIYDSQNIKS